MLRQCRALAVRGSLRGATRASASPLVNKRLQLPLHRPWAPCPWTDTARAMSSSSSIKDNGGNKSWVPSEDLSLQKVTKQALVHQLTQSQLETANKVVPWFLSQMPAPYFKQVPEEVRLQHLRAICALQDTGSSPNMTIKTEDADGRSEITFIRPGNDPGTLKECLSQLPRDFGPLKHVKVFSTLDLTLSLNSFTTGVRQSQKPTEADMASILQYACDIQAGKYLNEARHPKPDPSLDPEPLKAYMILCDRHYVQTADPRRFLRLKRIYDQVKGTEDCVVDVEPYEYYMMAEVGEQSEGRFWVSMIYTNVLPRVGLEKAMRLFAMNKLAPLRCHMDTVDDPGNGSVCMLRVLVKAENDDPPPHFLNLEGPFWTQVKHDLTRSKWVDEATVNLGLKQHPFLGIDRAEVIVAMSCMLHGVLAKHNMWAFSKANIAAKLSEARYVQYAAKIADLFIAKFDPENPLSPEEVTLRATNLRVSIKKHVEDTTASILLDKMLDVVMMTYRTNFFLPNRYSLAFRIDPQLMMGANENRLVPYGAFFVHGRRYNGFHVRFRDIARGGLRIVSPPVAEQIAIESARQYDEAYGLAFAQQLKNKDIPEGGSKAVVLVDTLTHHVYKGKDFDKRKAVKGFVDGLLDLILETPDIKSKRVDYLGKQEFLYLGPDEQIIPDDISWIVRRAKRRQYANPNTFMSSKPDAGINHKVYGVTSEGIAVFLAVALRQIGIDPTKDDFTIKLTGGTDGDVAGNMIKILNRDYGTRAKIVGLADGTGCIEDPNGLRHEELLRLFHDSLPLSSFNPSTLSPQGQFFTTETEAGIRARNTMHNRVVADAFLPAGGRPATIDHTNYRQFLKPDGTPSSRLIVEGANIFITPEARKKLFEEAGVLIVKDSSANKAGVICSSFEIQSAMLLTEEEFKHNKETIVAEVLEKLRLFAKQEAELLLREFSKYPGQLPFFSERISQAINTARDALTHQLDDMPDELYQELLPLFRHHLPPTVARLGFDKVQERVPVQYVKNAFASCLASHIVYREGTSFIESMPKEKLADTCLQYIRQERVIESLRRKLEGGQLDKQDLDRIRYILEVGGPRSLLD